MNEITIGIFIFVISFLGYASNWLNWRFLNYKINYFLYYVGAFVHETSHAVLCVLTGAKISEYKVFVREPHVSYSNSKLPVIGNLLIAIAPMFGGLAALFLFNKYFLANHYVMPPFSVWKNFFVDFIKLLKQINTFQIKDIITILLFLNIGATIGPSWQDLKNVWPLILILAFIPWPFFTHLGLLAIAMILINIIFQILFIAVISVVNFLF